MTLHLHHPARGRKLENRRRKEITKSVDIRITNLSSLSLRPLRLCG
ncbi:hypothetical protein [Microseira sp. BLCC-F43]